MIAQIFLTFLIGIYGVFRSREYWKLIMSFQITGVSSIISIVLLNPNLEMLSIALFGIEACVFAFLISISFVMKRKGIWLR